MTQALPLFKGEAMLLSWSDTSTRGKTVTFALHPDECPEVHPFRGLGTGKTGQRFALVAVPIDDEDRPAVAATPLPAPVVVPLDTPERRRFASLPLPQQIGMKCADRAFQAWIARVEGMGICDAESAAAWVRHQCEVETRAHIQPGTPAAALWSTILTNFEADTGRLAEIRS